MKGTFGFIGCGNMGGALVRAVVKAVPPAGVRIANRSREKAERLAAETGALVTDVRELAATCEYVFFGVKPQVMPDVSLEIADVLAARTDRFVLVSMAAGKTIAQIRDMFGNHPVIRIMPNLPVSIGQGVTFHCRDGVRDEEMRRFEDAMRFSGILRGLEERLFDAGCAVSGCGPAFVFLFISALIDGGVRCGLSQEEAKILACGTVVGAAHLLRDSVMEPSDLIKAVCSPGGATIEGIRVLEAGGCSELIEKAVEAACRRSAQL